MLAPIHQRRWHPPTHSIQPNQSWSFADCRLMGRAIVPRRKKAMAMMIRFCGWLRSGCCSVACRTNQGNVRVYSSLIEPNHLKGQGDLGAGIRNSTTAAAALQLLWVPWFLVSSALLGSLFHYPEFTIDLCSSFHHFSRYEAVT